MATLAPAERLPVPGYFVHRGSLLSPVGASPTNNSARFLTCFGGKLAGHLHSIQNLLASRILRKCLLQQKLKAASSPSDRGDKHRG